MRVHYLLTSIIALLFIGSCTDEPKELTDIEGTYEGIFLRSSPNAKYKPSQVTLTFSNGGFEGESEIIKYPAICNGTYKAEGARVEFSNSCAWTAEFDWSLILSGEFMIASSENELTLTRTTGSITDLYQLKRK